MTESISSLSQRREALARELTARTIRRYDDEEARENLIELAAAVPDLQLELLDIAAASPAELRELLRRACNHYASAMAVYFDPRMYRAASMVLRPLCGLAFGPGAQARKPTRSFESRLKCEGNLEEIRTLQEKSTVVFAPTHSSNLDSLVLGVALDSAGFAPCVYPAGKHLYRNKLAGHLVKRLGAYQLDRSISARLYKDLVVDYTTILLEWGLHAVVFASGTRSRTGEVESKLKLGLLGSILKASETRPIFVVPVTINYQVVPEAAFLIRYHLQGRGHERVIGDEVRKQGGMLELARRIIGFDQRALLHFGAPLVARTEIEESFEDRTRSMASELITSFRSGSRFFSTHLVARAIHARGKPAPLDEVYRSIETTREIIRSHPAGGRLVESTNRARPEDVLEEALAVWSRCHEEPPATMSGSQVLPDNGPLLLYYRNRTAHIGMAD